MRKLHLSSSERKERLLRRLANTEPKDPQRQLAKAVVDWKAADPSYLSFEAGDLFDVATNTTRWWQGYKSDASGYVFSGNVEAIIDPRETERHRVKAIYDFHAGNPSEINLKKDQIFMTETYQKSRWWIGFIGSAPGRFPANYVEVIASNPGKQ